jgi:hypothetical protein
MIGRRLRVPSIVAGLGVISASAWGQTVTLSDIEGTILEIRSLRQQTSRREGRERSNQIQSDIRITIDAGGMIHFSGTPTAYTKRGTRKGKPTSGKWTLEQTRELPTRGGGHGVWIFEDATLTFLRTYKGGALKRTIPFARDAKGLTCNYNETLVREEGVSGIVLESGIDGVPTTILSAKQISSSCRVMKGQAKAQ